MTISTIRGGRKLSKIRGTRKNVSGSSNYKEQIVKTFLQFLITLFAMVMSAGDLVQTIPPPVDKA